MEKMKEITIEELSVMPKVITTMVMFMIGNNYFNDILRIQSEFLTPASETN